MKKLLIRIKDALKSNSLFRRVERSSLYRKHFWYHVFKYVRKKNLLHEAIEASAQEMNERGNSLLFNILDYKRALNHNLVSYSEYAHQYEFPKLTDEQRQEYVSRLEMRLWYERNTNSPYIQNLFYKKSNWLKHFRQFIHRKWFDPREHTYESLKRLLEEDKPYIVKPDEGSLGEGIYRIEGKDLTLQLYEKIKNNKCIIEELVVNEPSLAAFHPDSLNTIRVMSLRNGRIAGSFIRFGNNGNVIDNAHAGGIFAIIDIEKGVIATDGIDTNGNTYASHPYSGKAIKGFKIPLWNQITALIKKLHEAVPEAAIVGWDICINQNNQIEIIEGNHLPDVDVLQSPQKIGIRKKLNLLLAEANLPKLKTF